MLGSVKFVTSRALLVVFVDVSLGVPATVMLGLINAVILDPHCAIVSHGSCYFM